MEATDTPEPVWQLSELRSETGTMLFRKLLDALPSTPNSNDHVVYLTFGCKAEPEDQQFYTPADTATLAEIDDTDIPNLEDATKAVLVGAVSAPRVRDFIFYTADPQLFLDTASPLRSRYSQFDIGCECSPDPTWSQYRDLPPAENASG